MFYAIVCWDRPGVGELREKTRHTHLEYLKKHGDMMHLGGPFESAEGAIAGTLFIINAADEAQAREFLDNEPFHKAGVFESVRLRRWRQMQPEVASGADAAVDAAAQVQLKQENV